MKCLLSKKTSTAIVTGLTLLATTNSMANNCTKVDIDYYLQRGFTHNQVVRLCSDTSTSTKTHSPVDNKINTSSYANTTIPTPSNDSLIEDRVYFETVLNAKTTTLTPNSLSYVSRECLKYGDEKLAGLKEKACANTKVTINLNGLQIIKAVKGVFLIRDQEMIIQGDIQREYLNIDSLPAGKQAVVRTQLPARPDRLNLPVRRGVDPKKVSEKLKKYGSS